MREGALFGTMFGLGAGAVLVGVAVSRLVIGQAPDKAAAEPPAVVTPAEPPASAAPRQRRALARRHPRPAVEETTFATASVADGAADTDTPPIAIVRGGAARPNALAPGVLVIQVEPQDGAE